MRPRERIALGLPLSALLLAAGCSSAPTMLMEPNARTVPVDRPAPPRALRPADRGDPQRAAQTHVGLAQGYMQRGEYEIAMERLRHALELDPSSADAHTVMAALYERLDRPQLAERHYERAARLAPDSGVVLNNYGTWLCRNGRAAEADGWFARALEDPFYPSPGTALANAGACAMDAGDPGRAEAYFRRSVELQPDDRSALQQLAQLSYQRGDYLRARAFLQRREAAGPLEPQALELGARIEDALGDTQAAQRYRIQLRDEFPEHTTAVSGG